MPLETATIISDLDPTWPLSSDPVSSGDDHIRLLKNVLQGTFANVNAAVTASDEEMNYLVGVTSGIQAQLDAITGATGAIPSGTVMAFFQAAAPVGWTQVTVHDNAALRVVSTSGGGSGGTNNFTTAFDSHVHATSGHALTESEIPSHIHTALPGGQPFEVQNSAGGAGNGLAGFSGGTNALNGQNTGSTGGGAAHTHGDTGAPSAGIDFKYLDMILATKD